MLMIFWIKSDYVLPNKDSVVHKLDMFFGASQIQFQNSITIYTAEFLARTKGKNQP